MPIAPLTALPIPQVYSHAPDYEVFPFAPGHFPRLPDGVFAVSLGNASRYEIWQHRYGSRIFIGVIGHGAYHFVVRVDAGYVAEKLKIDNQVDAAVIADYVNCQNGYLRESLLRPIGGYYKEIFHRARKETCELRIPLGREGEGQTLGLFNLPQRTCFASEVFNYTNWVFLQSVALRQSGMPAIERIANE